MGSKKIIYILLLCIFLTGCKNKTVNVTFDTLGGSVIEAITVEKGELLENIEEPTKEGHLFVTWLKDGIEYDFKKPITKDTTLTASWIETPKIPEYYTVTFVMEDHIEKITVNENEKAKEYPAPEKENYLFLGWFSGEELYDFDAPVTKNISLTAKYILNVLTVTYDLAGGIGSDLDTIPKNSQVPIPETPVREGYKFLKWTLNGEEFTFDTVIEEDITLTAEWMLIEYITINFDTDGGNQIIPLEIEKHSRIKELPTPTKEGYAFKEWELNNETFNSEMVLEEDITLKAIYTESN